MANNFKFYYKGVLLEELSLLEIAAKCEFHWADDVVVEYTCPKCGEEIVYDNH